MDWRVRLRRDELELRRIVRRLAAAHGDGPQAVASRDEALRALAAKIAQMKALIEDCLCGRNDFERGILEYKIRVEFPLFSHLGSLSMITPEYADWFCA